MQQLSVQEIEEKSESFGAKPQKTKEPFVWVWLQNPHHDDQQGL